MEKDNYVSQLVNTYIHILDEITFFQKRGDDQGVLGLLNVFIPLLSLIFENQLFLPFICLAVPIIAFVLFQRSIHDHTFVALLRGYAAYLEQQINLISQKSDFLYNSVCIDKYIANLKIGKQKNIRLSWISVVLSQGLSLMLSSILYIYSTWEYLVGTSNLPLMLASWTGIIVFVIMSVLLVSSSKVWISKEKIRVEAEFLPMTNSGIETIKELQKHKQNSIKNK